MTAYAQRWGEAYADACEATHVREEQSLAKLELRVACLDRGRRAFNELARRLRTPDSGVAVRMIDRAHALPATAPCSDLEALSRVTPIPTDPAIREQVFAVQEGLDAAIERGRWGDPRGSRADLEPLLDAAKATGYRPLVGATRYAMAQMRGTLNEEGAVELARSALNDALASGDDRLAVRAATLLVGMYGDAHSPEAQRWADTAWALLETFSHDVHLEVRLLSMQAIAFGYRQQFDEALELFERAAGLLIERDPEDPMLAKIYSQIGTTYGGAGQPAKAYEYMERSLEMARVSLGDKHPSVALQLADIARTWIVRDDYDKAEALLVEAHDVLVAAYGHDHSDVAMVEVELADALWAKGEIDRALASIEHAVKVLDDVKGGDALAFVEARVMYGSILSAVGRADEAVALLTRLANDPRVAADKRRHSYVLRRLAGALQATHRLDEAALRAHEAVAAQEASGALSGRASSYLVLGEIELDRGKAGAAVEALDIAVEVFETSGGMPGGLAEARTLLARALVAQGDLERARALAEQALAYFGARDDHDNRTRAAAVQELLDQL